MIENRESENPNPYEDHHWIGKESNDKHGPQRPFKQTSTFTNALRGIPPLRSERGTDSNPEPSNWMTTTKPQEIEDFVRAQPLPVSKWEI